MMLRNEPLFEIETVMSVVTDASPLGLGAILIQKSVDGERFSIIEAMESSISYEEADGSKSNMLHRRHSQSWRPMPCFEP